MQTAVSLLPFAREHLALLAAWLRHPHVGRWYPEPDENLAWAADPPPGGSQALIVFAARPVGYVRWQVVSRDVLDAVGLHEVPANAVDVDLLLGEADSIGRGIGPAALATLVARLRSDPALPLVGLTSSVDNTRAHRAFEKAGFGIARQYSPPGFGPCHLFTMRLRDA